jgi:hypothetical protein
MSDNVLNAILTGLTELQQGPSRLESGQQKLEHALSDKYDGLRAELTGFRADLMARVGRLQNTLTAIREDISMNMRSSDAGP